MTVALSSATQCDLQRGGVCPFLRTGSGQQALHACAINRPTKTGNKDHSIVVLVQCDDGSRVVYGAMSWLRFLICPLGE